MGQKIMAKKCDLHVDCNGEIKWKENAMRKDKVKIITRI